MSLLDMSSQVGRLGKLISAYSTLNKQWTITFIIILLFKWKKILQESYPSVATIRGGKMWKIMTENKIKRECVRKAVMFPKKMDR